MLCIFLLVLVVMTIATTMRTDGGAITTVGRLLRSHGMEVPIEVPEEEEEDDEPVASSISDVWLCMGIAFGWTIFTIRPLFQTSMSHYAKDAIPVQGHVLESKVDMSGGDTPGIPAYHAIIDYIYEHEGNTFQVRKAFTTDQLLEKGFANVWLVVLPYEPTSGMLQDDWEAKYKREQEEALAHSRIFCITLALGGIFVALSVAGAIHAVRKLPDENKQVGWICLTLAMALLGPAALVVYRVTKRCVFVTQQSIQEGKIIRGANFVHSLKPADCDTDPCNTMSGLSAPATNSDVDRCKSRKLSKQEGFYFVCMPSYDKGENVSLSTVSSISMRSLGDVGLNAYGERESSIELT